MRVCPFEFGIEQSKRVAVVGVKKIESCIGGIVGNELPDGVVDVVCAAPQRVEFALIVDVGLFRFLLPDMSGAAEKFRHRYAGISLRSVHRLFPDRKRPVACLRNIVVARHRAGCPFVG